jgi:hypothetical protein
MASVVTDQKEGSRTGERGSDDLEGAVRLVEDDKHVLEAAEETSSA